MTTKTAKYYLDTECNRLKTKKINNRLRVTAYKDLHDDSIVIALDHFQSNQPLLFTDSSIKKVINNLQKWDL